MRVIKFVEGTIVDGPGLRTSIYAAGCLHHCKGCHNPQSWDLNQGEDLTPADIAARVDESGFNVTLTGGDPLYQMDDTIELCRILRAKGYNIWCYTGFTFEEICNNPRLRPILDAVDVIVDGPFIETLRDITLRFRGSSNQRIIDVRRSSNGNIVLWSD